MTTSFPVDLDAFQNPTAADTLDSEVVPHSVQHANANDAIEAIQAKIGVNESGDTDSIDYKLAHKVDQVSGKGLSQNDYSDAEKTKLSGVAEEANNYTHPTQHAPSIIAQDSSNRLVTDAEKAAWNAKQAALGFTAEDSSQKGAASGYAPLGSDSKIPSTYLPSYVDDVVEGASLAAFPGTGETSKIYVALDSNKAYRWSGSSYVEISGSPGSTDAVTEGSTNLYFTVARVRAAVLTGLSLATNAAISATDTVLSALGKLQKQITVLATANTGDETAETIKTKLGITTLSGSNTGDQTLPTLSSLGAQAALVSGTNIKTINGATLLGAGNITITGSGAAYAFYKADSSSPAFTKTGAGTASVKAGVSIDVAGTAVTYATDTAITMPTLVAGTDYAIWVKEDGTIQATTNFSAAPGAGNWRKSGGFHYGLVTPGTTIAGGSFNTSGSPTTGGMVWTQSDVDKIAGINQWSIWDLKFRPACDDPRGMVLVNGRTWVDIYLCSTDTAANGTSKAGSNIASGTVLPKIPAAFGGNGTITYSALNWWVANELARANQKRLLLASEFYDAAFGVTENQSIDATASTYPSTQRNAGYTSKYGIEQAAGVHYTWGQDSAGSASAWSANGGRGQSYNNSVLRVLLGGSRAQGSNSGSRCSYWNYVASGSNWNIGLRAASDHLQLV